MGYRHFFYKVSIEDVDKVKNLSVEEIKHLKKEEDYISINEVLPQVKVFEFGKLYYCNTSERIYNKGFPLFDNVDTQYYFRDYVPFIVGKDGLLEAIKIFKEKTLSSLKDMFNDGAIQILPFGVEIKREEITSESKIYSFLERLLTLWEKNRVLNEDETDKFSITNSNFYMYDIFDLIHLLKTIDFEKDTLLFYGW